MLSLSSLWMAGHLARKASAGDTSKYETATVNGSIVSYSQWIMFLRFQVSDGSMIALYIGETQA